MIRNTSPWHDVFCDAAGCDDQHAAVRPHMGADKVRTYARNAGWTCNTTGDWCPAHKPGVRDAGGTWLGSPSSNSSRRRGGGRS